MGETIKPIEFRNGTGALRALAMAPDFEPVPVMTSSAPDAQAAGFVTSLSRVSDYLSKSRSGHAPPVRLEAYTAKTFYEAVRANRATEWEGKIAIVAFRQNAKETGTAIGFVPTETWESGFAQLARPRPALGWHTDARAQTNADIAADFTRPNKTLQNEIGLMAEAAQEGYIAYRRDGAIAAVDVKSALALKEHIYNGHAEIIHERTAHEFRNALAENCALITEKRHFIRVSGQAAPEIKTTAPLCTLIDGLSAEFLDISKGGKIRGVHRAEAIHYSFPLRASLCTDFAQASKIRLEGASDYQWAMIREGFEQARTRGAGSILQDTAMRMIEDAPPASDLRTSLNFSYSTPVLARLSLYKDGKIRDLSLAFPDQAGLAALAMQTPRTIEIYRGGANDGFSLERRDNAPGHGL